MLLLVGALGGLIRVVNPDSAPLGRMVVWPLDLTGTPTVLTAGPWPGNGGVNRGPVAITLCN